MRDRIFDSVETSKGLRVTKQLVSVILPAFRAAPVVVESVGKIRSAMKNEKIEIIVVDDGSDDDTSSKARIAGADQVIELRENRGKGCLLYTSPSPRDRQKARMPSSA